MKPQIFFATLLILFSPLLLSASQTSNATIPKSELKSNPFIAGSLKITFTRFNARVVISSEARNTGVGYIEVEVENTSDEFATFAPRRLSLVDKENDQADILGLSHRAEIFPAEERRMAPRARIKESYILTDNVNLPARIYYEDKLLGTITD